MTSREYHLRQEIDALIDLARTTARVRLARDLEQIRQGLTRPVAPEHAEVVVNPVAARTDPSAGSARQVGVLTRECANGVPRTASEIALVRARAVTVPPWIGEPPAPFLLDPPGTGDIPIDPDRPNPWPGRAEVVLLVLGIAMFLSLVASAWNSLGL